MYDFTKYVISKFYVAGLGRNLQLSFESSLVCEVALRALIQVKNEKKHCNEKYLFKNQPITSMCTSAEENLDIVTSKEVKYIIKERDLNSLYNS